MKLKKQVSRRIYHDLSFLIFPVKEIKFNACNFVFASQTANAQHKLATKAGFGLWQNEAIA